MEESKRRYEEERLYRETPAYRHWVWLVDQVHGDGAGFESLSRENKIFFAVKACIGDVYNGGFLQYFGNSASDFHEWALVGLEEIGGKKSLELLRSAAKSVWGGTNVPTEQNERIEWLHGEEEIPDRVAILECLEEFDNEFYKDEDDLDTLINNYSEERSLANGF